MEKYTNNILINIVLFFFKHKLIPIKKEELWFIIAALIGALGESVIMISGPWVYSVPEIINFPLWLPLLWGLAGTVGISLYQGVTGK